MEVKLCFNARNLTYGSGGTAKWSLEVFNSLKDISDIQTRAISPRFSFFGSGLGGYFWEQCVLPVRLRKDEILISPANLGSLLVKRQLLVIHDILPLTNSANFSYPYRLVMRFLTHILLKKLPVVLTVSTDTREQLLHFYPDLTSEIVVVGGGITPNEKPIEASPKPIEQYCLLIGGQISRKNLGFLLKFWDEIYLSTGCNLISTSRTTNDRALVNEFLGEGSEQSWHRVLIDLDDESLQLLYQNARFILQPSTGEGFGLPILEGMNCGTPFISNSVGVADELCIGESRIFPLEELTWKEYLLQRASAGKSFEEMAIQRDKASLYSWLGVAKKIVKSANSFRLHH